MQPKIFSDSRVMIPTSKSPDLFASVWDALQRKVSIIECLHRRSESQSDGG